MPAGPRWCTGTTWRSPPSSSVEKAADLNMLDAVNKAEQAQDVAALMADIGHRARAAALTLANARPDDKNRALMQAASQIRASAAAILAANALDVADAQARGTKGAFIDRLVLDAGRLEAVARAVEDIAGLADPVG